MQSFHRKPPLRKRHTKPCRFFQTSRCPLPQQECNFAHVLSNEVSNQSPNPCRYFAAGRCGNGSDCRYKHVIESSEDIDVKISLPGSMRNVETTTLNQTPLMFGETDQEATLAGAPPPFDKMHQAPSTAWQSPCPNYFSAPYSPGIAMPYLYHLDFTSPINSVDSSATLSTSTCSSMSDELVAVTEDPKYSEHLHQCQSRVRIADELPVIHVPPYYHPSAHTHVPVLSLDTSYPTLPNIYGVYGFQSPISPTGSVKTRPRSASRHKTINYRTKPCKFYRTNSGCPNGVDCTFIHDDSSKTASPARVSSPSIHSQKSPCGLPPKPVSLTEENKKKNFFPIAWRVIGGGVLMGEPKSSSTTGSISTEYDTDSEDLTKGERTGPPTRPITRARSSSIPSTPTITHVKVETLFSAESPGNL